MASTTSPRQESQESVESGVSRQEVPEFLRQPDPSEANSAGVVGSQKSGGKLTVVAATGNLADGAGSAEQKLASGTGVSEKNLQSRSRSSKARAQGSFYQLRQALFSSDRLTRWAAALFFFSLMGTTLLVGVITFLVLKKAEIRQRYERWKMSQDASTGATNFIKDEVDKIHHWVEMVNVGLFTLQLKSEPVSDLNFAKKFARFDLAQVEMVILCSDEKTKEFVKSHKREVRDQLAGILTAIDREQFLTHEGKKLLKNVMIRKLNFWIPVGRVVDILFQKLTIG